jgi:cysteinyl-tRNA synthetase
MDARRQMEWPSPWGGGGGKAEAEGMGFPGWHIECSVMGIKYLGDRFDIHTGGVDHIAIHHTNEIAQDRAATGKDPARLWLHNEFLLVDGSKMSKSLRNFFNMADIEAKGFDPLALRYLFLTAHYRSKINFTWKSLESAGKALDALRKHAAEWKKSRKKTRNKTKTKGGKKKIEDYDAKFTKSINDDLNTPEALGIVWELVRDSEVGDRDKLKLLLEFDEVFGLRLKDARAEPKGSLSDEVRRLITEREEGEYKEADEVRARLERDFGVVIEDTAKGTKWKFKKKP